MAGIESIIQKAEIALTLDKANDAFAIIKKGLQEFPENYSLRNIEAEIAVNHFIDSEFCHPILMSFVEDFPEEPQPFLHLASFFLQKRNYFLVEEALEHVLERDPENIFALTYLAEAEVEKHDYIKAKKYADRILSIDPYNSDATKVLLRLDTKKWKEYKKEKKKKEREFRSNIDNHYEFLLENNYSPEVALEYSLYLLERWKISEFEKSITLGLQSFPESNNLYNLWKRYKWHKRFPQIIFFPLSLRAFVLEKGIEFQMIFLYIAYLFIFMMGLNYLFIFFGIQ